MNDFTIKQNDTSPGIRAVLKDSQGEAVDLSGARVNFHLADPRGEVIINETALIINGPEGVVSYGWKAGDTARAGNYRAEWEVEFADGKVETFPNHGYIKIKIIKELA